MSVNDRELSRRDLFRVAGAAGLGSLVSKAAALGDIAGTPTTQTAPAATRPANTVPLRPFGKTGVNVPILALGGIFDITSNQLVLKLAMQWGVTYWDTAYTYTGGNSEKGMGMYLGKYPEHRKKIFLVSKTPARDPQKMTAQLNESLERLRTDYVDMYFLHGLRRPDDLTRNEDEYKQWIEKMKAAKKIRFFGFSTHRNMAQCLLGASKLGFIDGIMTSYNYRLMHADEMKRAVDACHKVGIGLTAMKTQAGGPVRVDSDKELELAGRFVRRGFIPEQAKLKAVWEDERIASLCSAMYTATVLSSNVAAALDKTKLSAGEKRLLDEYARETCSGYCAGCGDICEQAVGGQAPICDVMRHLMYYREYSDRDLARESFAKLPASVRRRLRGLDYSVAEARCPQGMPIGRLMREAADLLA